MSVSLEYITERIELADELEAGSRFLVSIFCLKPERWPKLMHKEAKVNIGNSLAVCC